jgi:surface polysaccharide O-acyltransferase-like enzyme
MTEFGELYNLLLLTGLVFLSPRLTNALVPVFSNAPSDGQPLRTDGRGRITVFDTMRGVAMLAVIVIHVVYFFLTNPMGISEDLMHAVNASLRFTIPIFLIASGILLTPPQRTYLALRKFYIDKVMRIGVPYLLTCIVLALVSQSSIREFLSGMVTGSTSVPFYFVLVLFQLYLVYPLVEPIAHKRWFVFATLAFTITNQFLPFYWSIFGVPTFFQYFFFFVWGIYMRSYIMQKHVGLNDRAPWYTLIALFAVLYAFFPGMYYNIRPYYGLAMFVVLFMLFSNLKIETSFVQFLTAIGRKSLWIFLIHFPIMGALFPLATNQSALTGTPLFVLAIVVSLVVSVASGFAVDYLYTRSSSLLRKALRPSHA